MALDDGVVGRARRAARELVGMTEVGEPARMAAAQCSRPSGRT